MLAALMLAAQAATAGAPDISFHATLDADSGNTVHQVRNRSGQLLEVVTDTAGRILSSRNLPR